MDIRAADVQHFEQVVERIVAEPFVDRTRSVIVLSRLVSRAARTSCLPVMPADSKDPARNSRNP